MIACNTNQVLSYAKRNAHIYVLYRWTTYLQLGQDFEFVTSQRVLATASVSGHSEMSVKREEDLELLIFQTFNKTLKIKTWKTGNPFGIKAEEQDVSFYRNCGAASVGHHNI